MAVVCVTSRVDYKGSGPWTIREVDIKEVDCLATTHVTNITITVHGFTNCNLFLNCFKTLLLFIFLVILD